MDVKDFGVQTKAIKTMLMLRLPAHFHTDRSAVAKHILEAVGKLDSLQCALDLNNINTFLLLFNDLIHSKSFNLGKCFQKASATEDMIKLATQRSEIEKAWKEYVAKAQPWI